MRGGRDDETMGGERGSREQMERGRGAMAGQKREKEAMDELQKLLLW